MKIYLLSSVAFLLLSQIVSAQNWLTTGNTGLSNSNFLGTKDNKSLIFKTKNKERGRLLNNGLWRFGTTANNITIDSNGVLKFNGAGTYKVGDNKYVFQNILSSNIGLFYNGTVPQYEFRNSSGSAVLSINADNGNSVLKGSLKIGHYTLPSFDGSESQVLTTDGSGVVKWISPLTTSLSNLEATSINRSLVPQAGNTIDIGAYDYGWKNIYLTGSIFDSGFRAFSCDIALRNVFSGIGAGITNTTGYRNAFFGDSSGFYNTTGYRNSFFGNMAGLSNTIGSDNAFFGQAAGFFNTTGGANSFFGEGSGGNNITGHDNSFFGAFAGSGNTTGLANCFFGSLSGSNNTTGSDNSFFGIRSGGSNHGNKNSFFGENSGIYNDGNENSFFGYYSGVYNSTGSNNVFMGSFAGQQNTTASNNTFAGDSSGNANTTGSLNNFFGKRSGSSNTSGNNNTFVGGYSGFSNTTASDNTFMGDSSGFNNTSGYNNTFLGERAGYTNTTGNNNIFIGNNAGEGVITGKDNVFLGANTHASNSVSSSIVIGFNINVSQNNIAVIGSSINKIGIGKIPASENILDFLATKAKLTTGGVWTDASSEKLKENFKELNKTEILNKINKLKITEWNYKTDDPKIKHIGPMAEEFYKLFRLGDDSTTAAMDKAGVALLAIQQLTQQNRELQKHNDELRYEITEVKLMVQQLQQNLSTCNPCMQSLTANKRATATPSASASLEQNIPNPFNHTTTINFTLPQNYTSAKILVFDKTGNVLKEVNISGSGKGSLKINASTLAQGAYNYSLYADGKLIDTRQMVLAR